MSSSVVQRSPRRSASEPFSRARGRVRGCPGTRRSRYRPRWARTGDMSALRRCSMDRLRIVARRAGVDPSEATRQPERPNRNALASTNGSSSRRCHLWSFNAKEWADSSASGSYACTRSSPAFGQRSDRNRGSIYPSSSRWSRFVVKSTLALLVRYPLFALGEVLPNWTTGSSPLRLVAVRGPPDCHQHLSLRPAGWHRPRRDRTRSRDRVSRRGGRSGPCGQRHGCFCESSKRPCGTVRPVSSVLRRRRSHRQVGAGPRTARARGSRGPL